MTDKEQIIINGVDVGECEYLTYQLGEDGQYYWFCNIAPAGGPDECEYNPECFCKRVLKKLACKTQECEELKERASIAEDNFACEIQARLYHQNEWLKFSKECEELKKQLKTSEKWRINAESLSEKLDIKNTRYRKALEEIEEYINNQGIDNKWNMRIQKFRSGILDIINNAERE